MKIAFITYQLVHAYAGGLETQIINLYNELKKYDDIEVSLFNYWIDKLDDFDAIHIFSPTLFPKESYRLSYFSKKRNKKVIISTIYWTYHKILHRLLSKIPFPFFRSTTYPLVRKALDFADILLPNTMSEAQLVKYVFNIDTPMKVIPNGVNMYFKNGKPDIFSSKYNIDPGYILHVGRIDRRKNILRLIKAFVNANLDTYLVIIGKIGDYEYFYQCKKISTKKVIFLPSLPHNSELLKSAYAGAKVFALPSLVETPGIAALEAGLAGANIVITKIGGTQEYFKNYAWYVNPKSIKSIKNALVEAYTAPPNKELIAHIEKNYSWETITKQYYTIYKNLM